MNDIKISIIADNSIEALIERLKTVDKMIDDIYEKSQKIGYTTTEKDLAKMQELLKIQKEITKQIEQQSVLNEKVEQERLKTEQQRIKTTKAAFDFELKQKKEIEKQTKETTEASKKAAKEAEIEDEKKKRSLKGLQYILTELRNQYDRLSEEERKNIEIGGKLLKQIQSLDAEVKSMQYGTGRFQANVGNYMSALQGGIGTLLKFGAVGSIITGISSAFGTLNGVVTSTISTMEKFVDAYNEGNTQFERFSIIAKQNMNANDSFLQSMKNSIDTYEQIGVLGDDIQLAGLQQLAIYSKQENTLKQLLPVMNDMIVQQYGLNATQENAISIAEMFGKAINGNTTILEKNGFIFNEAQKKILKYGTEGEKTAIIIDVVSQKIGGLNEKLAKTDAGRIQTAKNLIGNLNEIIGEKLLPILAKVYELFAKIAINFVNALEGITGFLSKITDSTQRMSMLEKATYLANVELQKQKTQVFLLQGVINDANTSLEQQKIAYDKLKEISPQYFGRLEAGVTTYEQLNTAINQYLQSLEKQLLQEAALTVLQEKYNEEAKIQQEIFKEQLRLKELQGNLIYEQERLRYETQQIQVGTDNALLLSQYQKTQTLETQIDNTSKRIDKLKNESAKIRTEAKQFIEFMQKEGFSVNIEQFTKTKDKSIELQTTEIDEVANYRKKMALQLSEYELKVKKDKSINEIEAEKLIIQKKIELQEQFVQWLSKNQNKYKSDYINAQLELIVFENNLKEKNKAIYEKNLKDFQNTQKLKEIEFENYINSQELLLEKQKNIYREQGKNEEEIARLTAMQVKKIEFEKLNFKIEAQKTFINWLEQNNASEIEIKQAKNTLKALETELERLKGSLINKTPETEQKGKSWLLDNLGIREEDLAEATSRFKQLYDEYVNFLNALNEARMKDLDKRLNALKQETEQYDKTLTELERKLEKENELRSKNEANNAVAIENEIMLLKQSKENKLNEEKKLLEERKKLEERMIQDKKRAIWIQFAIDEASAISSIIRYAMSNPLNSITSGLAGVLQISSMMAILIANFLKAKSLVRQLRKGEIDIQTGSGDKDDVPALLMRGESVINKEGTKRAKNTLKAINSNESFETIVLALQKDFGLNILKENNINYNVSMLGLAEHNYLLKKQIDELKNNNIYLQKILENEKNRKTYIPTKDGYIIIEKSKITEIKKEQA